MHTPPEVQFPVQSSCWLGWWSAALAVLVATQLWVFLAWAERPLWQVPAGILSATVVIGVVGIRAWKSPAGTLSWMGSHWEWSACRAARYALHIHWDFQGWMLVSLRASGHQIVWLGLNRAHGPHVWTALRRAVFYASTRGDAPGPAPVHRPLL